MKNTGTFTSKNQEILSNGWGPLLTLSLQKIIHQTETPGWFIICQLQ